MRPNPASPKENPEEPISAAPLGYSDYKSIILTFDHHMERNDGHRVQKMVMATQTALESVVSVMHYYKDAGLFTKASTLAALSEGAKSDSPVYIYTGPVNVQAVMDLPTYSKLLSHHDFGNGSELALTDKLTQFVARFQQASLDNRGGITPFLVINPVVEHAAETTNSKTRSRTAR